MKIKPQHLLALKIAICRTLGLYDTKGLVHSYETGNFPRSETVKDLQMRFCFDVFHASNFGSTPTMREIYEYANDDHLFTALKAICPKVEKKY